MAIELADARPIIPSSGLETGVEPVPIPSHRHLNRRLFDQSFSPNSPLNAIHEEPTSSALEEIERETTPSDPGEENISLDPVELYLRDISRRGLLTAAEEVFLAKTMEQGKEAQTQLNSLRSQGEEGSGGERSRLEKLAGAGDEARNKLIESNLRLVVAVAKKYSDRGLPLLDLIQEGNIGLHRATKGFDWRRGFKFCTYATWWIRQAVTKAIADQSRTIRIPMHVSGMLGGASRATRELIQELGREPTMAELAERMDVPLWKIQELQSQTRHPLSLDAPMSIGENGDESKRSLAARIPDQNLENDPEHQGEQAFLADRLNNTMKVLTDEEKRVLILRFGLEDGKQRTLAEIGEEMGFSRERARQLEAKAFWKLRTPTLRAQLREYLAS